MGKDLWAPPKGANTSDTWAYQICPLSNPKDGFESRHEKWGGCSWSMAGTLSPGHLPQLG